MKKILVPTDFSSSANYAARYALLLAKTLEIGLELCHAVKIPGETPIAARVAWPLQDYNSIKTKAMEDLGLLAKDLEMEEQAASGIRSFHPPITYTCQVGTVTNVVRNLVEELDIPLVVMGLSGAGALNKFFMGSNSHDMIENANFPVLLIPYEARLDISKIAFATDFSKEDIERIIALANLIRPFQTAIMVAHVSDKKLAPEQDHLQVDDFLNELKSKIQGTEIYYQPIHDKSVDAGLDWLCQHGQIDILTMVHKRHNWLTNLFNGSHTQKLAKEIEIPLLVFPVV